VKRFADDGTRLTDCCGAYSTFSIDDGDLMCRRCYECVEPGEGDGAERLPAGLADEIRSICAREFDMPADSEFFSMDWLPGESADAALLRIFCAEHDVQTAQRGAGWSVEQTVLVLIYG